MYAIHTTPGFIVDSRPFGEAGKLLSVFTAELGLVLATAQGIRLEKSKLRYHTSEYSFGTFSFVRGKEFWRLTSAQHDTAHSSYNSNDIRGPRNELWARVALLLRRLLHGEEAHPELFAHLEACQHFLSEHRELSSEQFKTLESVLVLRILHVLGYIGKDIKLEPYWSATAITPALLDDAAGARMVVNQHINKALKESHL